MITHELLIDTMLGEASVEVELLGPERYPVLRACNAPLSQDFRCKVFVRLEYEALTAESCVVNSQGGGSDADPSNADLWSQGHPR